MARKPTELCPFCGDLFETGIARGEHMRARHRPEIRDLLADHDQAALNERGERNLHHEPALD